MKNWMDIFRESIRIVASIPFVIMLMGIGCMLFCCDAKKLKMRGNSKDSKIAKVIGITYFILGICFYVIDKFI